MEPLYKKFSRSSFDKNGRLNNFEIVCNDNFNFGYDVVDAIAAAEPKKTALVWCDIYGNERTLTFSDISKLSNKAAHVFQKYGIGKGDRVMLMLKRHYEYWYVINALHKLGAVVIPATHMLKKKDIVYRVNKVGVKAIVCAQDNTIIESVASSKPECETLTHLFNVRDDRDGFIRLDTELEDMPDTLERVETNRKEPFMIYFTSGTTGYPKAVTHNYTYPLCHIPTALYWHGVQNGGLHFTVSDTGWGKASWGKIYGQWLCGCAVMVYDYEKFEADKLTRVIKKYGVTSFCAPPTIYRFIVKNEVYGDCFDKVYQVTTAGESLNPAIIERFREATGLLIREAYGQTETVMVCGNLVGEKTKVGSIGRPNPLYDVHILDDDGKQCAPGEHGEICIYPKDANRFGICIENGDANDSRAWVDGVFHTGDVAYMDEDGYIFYIGRKDDIIKSSGYRIGPFEIEDVLIKHNAVAECAVTGVPDEERGYVVKATIVLQNGFAPSDSLKKELQDYVKESTAPYKYPRIVEFVSELPKTISGKIRRAKLRGDDKS